MVPAVQRLWPWILARRLPAGRHLTLPLGASVTDEGLGTAVPRPPTWMFPLTPLPRAQALGRPGRSRPGHP